MPYRAPGEQLSNKEALIPTCIHQCRRYPIGKFAHPFATAFSVSNQSQALSAAERRIANLVGQVLRLTSDLYDKVLSFAHAFGIVLALIPPKVRSKDANLLTHLVVMTTAIVAEFLKQGSVFDIIFSRVIVELTKLCLSFAPSVVTGPPI